MSSLPSDSGAERSLFIERGRRLEYMTILWNSLEALAALISGLIAQRGAGGIRSGQLDRGDERRCIVVAPSPGQAHSKTRTGRAPDPAYRRISPRIVARDPGASGPVKSYEALLTTLILTK